VRHDGASGVVSEESRRGVKVKSSRTLRLVEF
jgi:hypothetical protein